MITPYSSLYSLFEVHLAIGRQVNTKYVDYGVLYGTQGEFPPGRIGNPFLINVLMESVT